RIRNPVARTPNVPTSEASRFSVGRNCRAMTGAKKPNRPKSYHSSTLPTAPARTVRVKEAGRAADVVSGWCMASPIPVGRWFATRQGSVSGGRRQPQGGGQRPQGAEPRQQREEAHLLNAAQRPAAEAVEGLPAVDDQDVLARHQILPVGP